MKLDMSRRALLRLIPVAFAMPVSAQQRVTPRLYKVNVPQATVDRILRRVRETRLPDPRSLLERTYNLVHYTKMPRGGHFACLEEPELFVEDVRQFFRKVRS